MHRGVTVQLWSHCNQSHYCMWTGVWGALILVEHTVVLQGVCMDRDGHGRSLLLEKQLFFLITNEGSKDRPLNIFDNTGRVYIIFLYAFQCKTAMMFKNQNHTKKQHSYTKKKNPTYLLAGNCSLLLWHGWIQTYIWFKAVCLEKYCTLALWWSWFQWFCSALLSTWI